MNLPRISIILNININYTPKLSTYFLRCTQNHNFLINLFFLLSGVIITKSTDLGEHIMSEIILLRPTEQYAKQVMAFREEMLQNNEDFDGCAGLENVQSFDEWINFEARLKAMYKSGYVPSEVFLAVRQKDDSVVGIIDFRHPLSDFLLNFGGNIGYSVRPSEGKKVMRLKCLD